MSSGKYAAPLQLDLLSSRFLLILAIVVHGLALAALFFIALPLLVLLGLLLVIVFHALYFITVHALRKARKSVVRVIWEDNGRWYVVRRSGEKVRVQLRGDSFVTPVLTILNFKLPDKWFGQSVILVGDNVNLDTHRRLRARLKMASPQELYE